MTTAVLDRWKERAAVAESNRAAMPIVTALLDELREQFPDCRVTYAAEAGRTFGSRGREGVPASPGYVAEKKRRRS